MDWRNNIIAPAISAVVISAIYFSVDFFRKAPSHYVVPEGAIVAFNLTKCPDGWSAFDEARGRTIIGIGKGNELSEYTLGQRGGSETHTLTVEELPKHQHKNWPIQKKFQSGNDASAVTDLQPQVGNSLTAFTGDNRAHNIMQPWISLLYCEKI